MASTVGTRLAFEKAKQAINDAGFSMQTAILSQSYLRLEVLLSPTITNYQFPVLVNDTSQANQAPTIREQRLQLQDAFVVSQCGFFFINESLEGAGACKLYSYPDSQTFGLDTFGLNQWYNERMSITVNGRVIVPAWDLYRHFNAPAAQYNPLSPTQNSFGVSADEFNGNDTGFYPVEPSWVLIGSKQNTVQVNLSQAPSISGESNLYACLILRGHLAQNVTPVR